MRSDGIHRESPSRSRGGPRESAVKREGESEWSRYQFYRTAVLFFPTWGPAFSVFLGLGIRSGKTWRDLTTPWQVSSRGHDRLFSGEIDGREVSKSGNRQATRAQCAVLPVIPERLVLPASPGAATLRRGCGERLYVL